MTTAYLRHQFFVDLDDFDPLTGACCLDYLFETFLIDIKNTEKQICNKAGSILGAVLVDLYQG